MLNKYNKIRLNYIKRRYLFSEFFRIIMDKWKECLHKMPEIIIYKSFQI